MEKLVVLKIQQGNFDKGFPISASVRETEGDRSFLAEISGNLPPSSEIPQHYQKWHDCYRNKLDSVFRMTIEETQILDTDKIREECRQSTEKLREFFKRWVSSEACNLPDFREKLCQTLGDKKEYVHLIIQTDHDVLKKLPWSEWNLFSDSYTNSEFALCATSYERVQVKQKKSDKIRILAILGNSEGIDIEKDREQLEKLPDADTCFLTEPGQANVSDRLWEEHWDIFFFAGHSSSQGKMGEISINKSERMTVEKLKKGLRRSIKNGLKLAIFNSCDGLKLAEDLADLNIPQIIVMREPVPDSVAQAFLRYFLSVFSDGRPLYLAVREARERLDETFDDEYPGVGWLPVLYHNPAVESFCWKKEDCPDSNNLFSELSEWKFIHHESQRIVAALSETFNYLKIYRDTKDFEYLIDVHNSWMGKCRHDLTNISNPDNNEWKFQKVCHRYINEVKECLCQSKIETITEQIKMIHLNERRKNYDQLFAYITDIHSYLWTLLDIADKNIKKIVDILKGI